MSKYNYIFKEKQIKENATLNSEIQARCDKLINRINALTGKINKSKKIDECIKYEKELSSITNELGNLEELARDNSSVKTKISRLNSIYRNLQNKFINKEIELANKNITELEETTKEITGNAIFPIASIFLGISLTSAIVAGIDNITNPYITILFLLTGGLIILFTVGISSILLRKVDKKSVCIIIVMVLYISVYVWASFTIYNKISTDNSSNIASTEGSNTEPEEKSTVS